MLAEGLPYWNYTASPLKAVNLKEEHQFLHSRALKEKGQKEREMVKKKIITRLSIFKIML